MTINCKVVQDLLPLYHDGVCSEESRKLVEAHLNECASCKRMLAEMDGEWVVPTEAVDIKPLERITQTVKKGRRKALLAGVAITLSVVILLFGGYNVWWYTQYYRFYHRFAEGRESQMIHIYDDHGNVIDSSVSNANEYVWEDEIYRYRVVVPGYLERYGVIEMERLDGREEGISLSISRGITDGYTYTVFIDHNGEKDGFEVFMLDPDLNQEYLKHWDEETITEQNERFAVHREEILEIVKAAKEAWDDLR